MRVFVLFCILLSTSAHAGICGRVFAFLAGLPQPLPVKTLSFDPERLPERIPIGDGIALSRAQYVALARAEASGHYQVELVRKVVDGVPRVLVLLGETHVKGKTAAALGRAVLNEFPVRGLEGIDSKKNWGGRALDFLMAGVERVVRFLRLNGGSTIDHARKGAHQVFELEDGHVPDAKEQVGSVYVPGLLVTCAAAMCASAYASAGLPAEHTVREISAVALAAAGLHAVAGRLIGPFVSDRWRLKYFLHPVLGLGPARSSTMARNLNTALENNRDIDTILVVVGRAHVPQIRGDLEEKFRYSGSALPPIESIMLP